MDNISLQHTYVFWNWGDLYSEKMSILQLHHFTAALQVRMQRKARETLYALSLAPLRRKEHSEYTLQQEYKSSYRE